MNPLALAALGGMVAGGAVLAGMHALAGRVARWEDQRRMPPLVVVDDLDDEDQPELVDET